MTEYQIEIVEGKKGYETIKVNNYFLHSKYDPIREAKQFAEKNYKAGNIHILFGYGKGYIAEALLNEFKYDEKLIVIEPILKAPAVKKENIILIQSSSSKEIIEEIQKYSHLYTLNNIHVLCSVNYDKICPDLYRELLANIKEKVSVNLVNINTINYMSQEWQRNYIFNIKHAIRDTSIHALHKFTNLPVIVASGGPSLTKQIPLIKKIRNQVILVSSGSTINSLLKENIEPDFILSIDSQEANYNHFKKLKFKNARLVYHMYHHYKIRDSFEMDGYYFVSQDEKNLSEHLSGIVKEKVDALHGGTSVANFAFAFAHYITSGPIALIGQDLAYTDNKSHAENNRNYKVITEEDIKRRGMFYTEGYYGEKVLTDNVFLSMKFAFENLIKLMKDNENIYNCTEGGIRIIGFKQMPFAQFVEKFVNNQVATTYQLKNNKKMIEYKEVINFLKNELEKYNKIKRLISENLRLIAANPSNTQFTEKTLKKLDKNDEIIAKERDKTCLQVILGPLNIAILKDYRPKPNETPKEAYERVVAQNKALYNGYLDAIKITKNYIEEFCEQLQ